MQAWRPTKKSKRFDGGVLHRLSVLDAGLVAKVNENEKEMKVQ